MGKYFSPFVKIEALLALKIVYFMGGQLFIRIVDRIGKIPALLAFFSAFFLILWWMFFYVGWRFSVIFDLEYTHRFLISLWIAGAGVFMNFCNFAKKKEIHFFALLFLWGFTILMVSTFILVIEHALRLNVFTSSVMLGVGVIGFILALLLFGHHQHKTLITTPVHIQSPKLKHPRKIVFVTDLHADGFHGKRFLKNLVWRILLENPDLVLLGGDSINLPQPNYVHFFQAFQRLKMPVYGVIGNHDIDFNGDTLLIDRVFKVGKIIPLRNQTIQLFDDLQLVGIDDKELWGNKHLKAILAETHMQDNGKYTILLSHRPYRLSKLAHTPVDLELAGHTHAGQIWGLKQFAEYLYDYVYGLYTWKQKKAFVSQGVGAITPIRL